MRLWRRPNLLPEFRKNPITGRWVIVATERARRPSDFSHHPVPRPANRPCPFCPGNEHKTPPEVYRRNGQNPDGWLVRVVPNKFPVLGIHGDLSRQGEGLFDKMSGIGAHEVIIENPEHGLSLADLPESNVQEILLAFCDRIRDLKGDKRFRYILLFKNHGEAAGASLEHSHSQLIALPIVPKQVLEELKGAQAHFDSRERCIYCDIIHQECQSGVRLVTESDRFVALEPYAPRFPFETWLLPKTHQSHFEDSDTATLQNLAWVLRSTLRKMEKVLERPAYNFVIHTGPLQSGPMPDYHWHFEIMPRLTRVAGFEWGTGFYINPTPPEESAQFLREAGLG